ncbi:expressed unknown protein (Partial), partial [Seminavis robusta]
EWFSSVKERLQRNYHTAPLFDTPRWVRNLETGLLEIVALRTEGGSSYSDIEIMDNAGRY